MGRDSKKPPGATKNFNIPLDGELHQRISRMAEANRRSKRQEILACLETCLERWEGARRSDSEGGASTGDREDNMPPTRRNRLL